MSKQPTYKELKQMKPEDRKPLLEMVSLASAFGVDLFSDAQKKIARIEREEAEQRAAEALRASQERAKSDAEAAARAVVEAAAREAAEAATKSAALVLTVD